MTHFPIKDRLLPLLRRKRTARLWIALGLCWLMGCLLGLCFMILGAFSGGLPSALLPLVVILSGAAAGVCWIRHRRSRPDWRGCAREIESKYPELDGRLLTAIEQEPDAQGRFSYLQHRLFDEVLAHDRVLHWDALFSKSRVGFIKMTHALAFAAFLVTCLRLGSLPGATLGGTQPAQGVVVTPGDTSLERGDNLVVMVRFNATVPSGVDLVVRQTGKPVQRIPLVKSLEDPMFGGSIAEVTDDLDYSVEYGRRTSRDFAVTVFDYPRMERADADLIYPEYTALPAQHIEDTRHVTAVRDTQVDLTLQLNKPVTSARLMPKNGGMQPVVLETHLERPLARLTGFALVMSERYSLQLVDADGRTNKQAVQFAFNVLSNRVPEMQITAPRGDIRPSALEEVDFAGTVFDDFGVLAYGLAYFISGQDIRTVELGTQVPAKEKRSFEHMMPFEDLGLEPGDLVSWFFWSEDIGPDAAIRRTMGDLYFAEVRPFDEIFRQGQSQFGRTDSPQQPQQAGEGGRGQTAKLAELQQQIIHATWKLQREHGTSSPRNLGPPQSSIRGEHQRDVSSRLSQDDERARRTSTRPRRTVHPDSELNGFIREMLDSSAPILGRPSPFFAQPVATGRADQPLRQERAASSSAEDLFDQDIQVVVDAQRDALAQAEEARTRQGDPRQIAMWGEAVEQMELALEQLIRATNSPAALAEALAAQQSAYQRLLRLQEREFSVSQNRNQSGSGSQSSGQQRMQRQLDQLDLTSEENRYETERLAQAPQSAAQREQLQVMSRLAELARRQQDINERLQELQTALQAAQTEEAREELRRELKRLRDEQQQTLTDFDELRQRMDSQENQSQFTEQREQLEQTRESVQQAAEAAQQGAVSQALAAGTRAQREMQQMREELRNQSASAFADDMRQMRSEARELTRQQEAIQNQLEELDAGQSRSLSDSRETDEVRERLAQQRERLTNLVQRATQVSQLAEAAEPLMSSSLYETLREFSQDDLGTVKEVQEELLANGMFPLYERLKRIAGESGAKTLDMTSEVLGEGLPELARQTGQRAQQDIDDLARGIERAAELVLGDDTEALRLAERELQNLTDQVADEITRAGGRQTNAQSLTATAADAQAPPRSNRNQAGTPGGESEPASPQGEATRQQETPGSLGEGPSGQLAQAGEPEARQNESGQAGNGSQGTGQRQPQAPPDSDPQQGSGGFDFDRLLGGGRGGGNPRSGPITGDGFGPWSDRLREVEELVELPDLRNELIRARERVRQVRRDYTRDQRKPDWARVQLEVVEPLVEVRKEIGHELARRQSRENLAPIDRDPVPDRYSERVRRYYEDLGRDEPE